MVSWFWILGIVKQKSSLPLPFYCDAAVDGDGDGDVDVDDNVTQSEEMSLLWKKTHNTRKQQGELWVAAWAGTEQQTGQDRREH